MARPGAQGQSGHGSSYSTRLCHASTGTQAAFVLAAQAWLSEPSLLVAQSNLEGCEVLYNIIFCYVANILLHIVHNLMILITATSFYI